MQTLQHVKTSDALDSSDVSGEVSWTQDSQANISCAKQPERFSRATGKQVLVHPGHMHKLARGHIHLHGPANIANTTPDQLNELTIKAATQDTPQGGGDTAFGNQEQYSHDRSEEPQNSWSDAPEIQADKRRKLNRESARRIRVRKHQQMQSLEAEVAQLKSEDVSKGECIKLLTKKIREMTSETRRLRLEYQMLVNYVGEPTATCRSKEAALHELQNRVRPPEGTQHVALPFAEQAEKQLSADSLHFMHSQTQQQGANMPDGHLSKFQKVQSESISQSQAPSMLQMYMAGHQAPLDRSCRPTPNPLQTMCFECTCKPVTLQSHTRSTASAHHWIDSHMPQSTLSDPSFTRATQPLSATGKRCSSLPPNCSREDLGSTFFATHTDERQQVWSVEQDKEFQAHVQNVLQQQQQQQQQQQEQQQQQQHRFGTGPPCKAATLYTAAPLPTATASQLQTSAACMQDLPEQTVWSKQRFAPDLLVQALGVEPEQRDDAAPGHSRWPGLEATRFHKQLCNK